MKLRLTNKPKSEKLVTTPDIYSKDGYYHPEGLFSEQIFGPVRDYRCQCGKYQGRQFEGIICENCGVEVTTSEKRRKTYAKIELPVPAIHPLVLMFLMQNNKVKTIMNDRRFDEFDYILNLLDEIENTPIEEIPNTSYKTVKKLIMKGFKFTDFVSVIPPDLRPRFREMFQSKGPDINQHYIRILRYKKQHVMVKGTESSLMFTYSYELLELAKQ